MIVTVTFNPSIDYVIRVPGFAAGGLNRTASEDIFPGGKGINVSVILSRFGIPNRALGFLAGPTGEIIDHMLKDYGIATDFIRVADGFSRINVKMNAGQETEINGQGPVIPEEARQILYRKLGTLESGDYLVLAGSIPQTLETDTYERILSGLEGKGVRYVVDAEGELLKKILPYHPFLIKPNKQELEQIFSVKITDEEKVLYYAKKLQKLGAQNVIISMGGDGALLLTEKGEAYHCIPPKGKVVNSTGAGDSMVAGFLAGILLTGDYERALAWGTCAGSATAFTSWLATRKDMEVLAKTAGINLSLEKRN